MKRTTRWMSAAALLLMSGAATAAEVNAYFDAATNKLVIPHLEVNGQVYHATLSLIDAGTLTFRADAKTLLNLAPPSGTTLNPSTASLVGTWGFSQASQDTISLRADGTYTQFQFTVSPNDPTCVRGQESGTYTWERSTGVLIARVLQDANRDCGLSESGAIRRVYVDGPNAMRLFVTSSDGETEIYPMTRNN
jgi:hypothetical protein